MLYYLLSLSYHGNMYKFPSLLTHVYSRHDMKEVTTMYVAETLPPYHSTRVSSESGEKK